MNCFNKAVIQKVKISLNHYPSFITNWFQCQYLTNFKKIEINNVIHEFYGKKEIRELKIGQYLSFGRYVENWPTQFKMFKKLNNTKCKSTLYKPLCQNRKYRLCWPVWHNIEHFDVTILHYIMLVRNCIG